MIGIVTKHGMMKLQRLLKPASIDQGVFLKKAQYLRIQATYLLQSSDVQTQKVGRLLLERLVTDYPEEDFSTPFAKEQLGGYYLRIGIADFEKAEYYYRSAVEFCERQKSTSGTSGMAKLRLARTILLSNQTEKFEEAYQLVTSFPVSELLFNCYRFEHAELAAHLCAKMKKNAEAKEYAKNALELAKITEPDFSRHKTLGLVHASDEQLEALKKICS